MYTKSSRPVSDEQDVGGYVEDELEKLESALRAMDYLQLVSPNEAPAKPREGLVVFTDATAWDPGSGAGFYGYRGGAWRKLDT